MGERRESWNGLGGGLGTLGGGDGGGNDIFVVPI